MKAIKTFRDLLSFLTIIPLGKTEDFVVTSAENIFLFPLIGALIGVLGAAYFQFCGFLISSLLAFINLILGLTKKSFLIYIINVILWIAEILIIDLGLPEQLGRIRVIDSLLNMKDLINGEPSK